MKSGSLVLFMIVLIICTFSGISLIYGLFFGLILFFAMALLQGHKPCLTFKKAVSGIFTVKKILLLFILAGMVSSLWRASGTLYFLVFESSRIINPDIMLPLDFLLCVFVSFLTGTSFGTAATMGVVAMVISNSMGINPMLSGGAIISGIFFGDRASPVSTTAMLIADITGSDIHQNLKRLWKESIVPVVITTFIYFIAGLLFPATAETSFGSLGLYPSGMVISPVAVIPALLILILSFFSMPVLLTLSISVFSAMLLAFFLQKMDLLDILSVAFFGYVSNTGDASGGIVSMTGVFCIVLISSCFVGIFRLTDMLEPVEKAISRMERHLPRFLVTLISSFVIAIAACNQTLTIILTKELCSHLYKDGSDLAVELGDSAALMPALIPWSIAVSTPIASIGAPLLSIPFAFFLMVLPLWKVLVSFSHRRAAISHV